jgi:cyclophilin family peptidyl-prolyl cis-trans isomerase
VAVIIILVVIAVGVYVYITAQSSNSLPPVVYAKLNTSQGSIEVALYYNATPKTVTNFVNLAQSGFYNNLVWHRIVRQFVIQTGDPYSKNGLNNSTWGTGGSPQTIPSEIRSYLHNYAGYLGMAYANGPDSATSQFYINLNDTNASKLDGSYTVFGKVINGMSIAFKIANLQVYPGTPTIPSDQPVNPSAAMLTSVSISNSP